MHSLRFPQHAHPACRNQSRAAAEPQSVDGRKQPVRCCSALLQRLSFVVAEHSEKDDGRVDKAELILENSRHSRAFVSDRDDEDATAVRACFAWLLLLLSVDCFAL